MPKDPKKRQEIRVFTHKTQKTFMKDTTYKILILENRCICIGVATVVINQVMLWSRCEGIWLTIGRFEIQC